MRRSLAAFANQCRLCLDLKNFSDEMPHVRLTEGKKPLSDCAKSALADQSLKKKKKNASRSTLLSSGLNLGVLKLGTLFGLLTVLPSTD